MVCLRLKRHVLNCIIFSDYDSLPWCSKKKHKKNDRIVNIDKEKYEINSLHVTSCHDFICKEIFVVRLSNNQYKSTHNSYNMYEKNKLNINIASIFITLTEINNETYYVAKKIKNKIQNKTPPQKTQQTSQNCSDRIRTLSVNLQRSRSSDYTITAMVQWSNL